MSPQQDHESDLKKTIRDGRAVIVAGTGVSMAASVDPKTGKPHPQASWGGLLMDGLQWLKDHNLADNEVVDAHLALLKKKPRTHHFISAAEDVVQGMGGAASKHFADWLARTVGSITAHDRAVLDCLDTIRQQSNLLATTNYDGLLLDGKMDRDPITWLDTGDLVGAVRSRDMNKVIFLHGYWRRPDSVVLDWKSYDRIVRDDQYREDLLAFWKTHAWIYVGCGTGGLDDPDLGLLLERYGKRARQNRHWDYCLVCDGQRDEFQTHFDANDLNIRAIPFGETHAHLPGYLQSLVPAPEPATVVERAVALAQEQSTVPKPPDFYAEPDYIGSHQFVGRDAQIHELDDWAARADPTNLLLFDAIGGNGKSMLTWEWTTKHATRVRDDWAGRFWYSFYERGALMADFCQHALAYMTGRPLKEFAKKKTAQLKDDLLAQLHAKPWLLILDGLERVLVAYHRVDAAEIPDEEANVPTDKIANRDPCDAIRDEDNDLLRALASAAPSKVLVSSRLTPRVLLNPAGQPIPGARRINLPGLRPADAEKLLRSCGIEGDSTAIQNYLRTNCDNHPLVIGVLAGLIQSYLPARGDFDQWAADPEGGAKLDLASLDLIQRRNHILCAALEALPHPSHELLSTLALLSESVDYETLSAFNPHLPPEPDEVAKPRAPEGRRDWESLEDEEKAERQEQHEAALVRWQDYQKAVQDRLTSQEYREAPRRLEATVRDLEQRGLLQYDGRTRRHDLHPVVRGVASGGMKSDERERYGQRVVDHFSSLAHNPYEDAETFEDLRSGLNVVRTLLKLGRLGHAAEAYLDGLNSGLLFNVEGYAEILSLLRPLFPSGWDALEDVSPAFASAVANEAAIALSRCGESVESLAAYGAALRVTLESSWDIEFASPILLNISGCLEERCQLAKASRVCGLALDLAAITGYEAYLFGGRRQLLRHQFLFGQFAEADATWRVLAPMGRSWPRATYRVGGVEAQFAESKFWQGTLREVHLAAAERLATEGRNRPVVRDLHRLRGAWRLEQGEWALAAASFAEAVRMARERGILDAESETGLALAKHHLGQLDDAPNEAERLAQVREPSHRYLAMLWLALGDLEQAKRHTLAAYKWAWADGEPYVHRYELTKTSELLNELGVPIPDLPPYDPEKDEPFPWEADVHAAIEKLRSEKEAKEKAEAEGAD